MVGLGMVVDVVVASGGTGFDSSQGPGLAVAGSRLGLEGRSEATVSAHPENPEGSSGSQREHTPVSEPLVWVSA